ncbi:MAG: ABC transporter permease [Gemmobacter sp.]
MKDEGKTLPRISRDADGAALRLAGDFVLPTLGEASRQLATVEAGDIVAIDCSQVGRIDTAGAWIVAKLQAEAEAAGRTLRLTGASVEAERLIATVAAALPQPDPERPRRRGIADWLESAGRVTAGAVRYLAELAGFLGLFLSRLVQSLVRPREFRLTALVAHCHDVGVRAVPIVALMAFLIGVVLAFQGASQLRQFGAEVFVVDLIAVSILRELGILLTAIIVAGRTASAFTAAIGSMKMREEIDAMRTLGIDPGHALLVPRVLALLLMLPILGLIANVSGLVGGAIMAWIELGISPGMFRIRLVEDTDVSHLIVGMVKAPVFAIIIGIIGCHAGMQVGNNAESLGRMTSASVVAAIFAVIVADALFSVFFAQVGL